MGQGGKQQKTDRRDSAELVDSLDRYLRGQDKALSVVAVPSVEQEEKRALIRYHRQIMADRGRYEARDKGLLCAQGLEVGGRWWQGKGWRELNSDPRLKEWIKEQLEAWRQKVLGAEAEQKGLRRRIEALAPAILPKGVGAYSAAVLEYEMKGWGRFKNRRQVASYTGLCPGIHQSDGRGKEGSINRCGNRIVRCGAWGSAFRRLGAIGSACRLGVVWGRKRRFCKGCNPCPSMSRQIRFLPQ